MQLVVLGGQTLDELQHMVVESFSQVAAAAEASPGGCPTPPSRVSVGADGSSSGSGGQAGREEGAAVGLPAEATALAAAGMPLDSSCLGRLFRVQPVRDTHRLHVSWQLGEQLRCVLYLCVQGKGRGTFDGVLLVLFLCAVWYDGGFVFVCYSV